MKSEPWEYSIWCLFIDMFKNNVTVGMDIVSKNKETKYTFEL